MKSSQRDKFDGAPARLPAHMFQPVTDLLSWRDLESPASSYPTEFPEWKDEAEEVITDVLANGDVLSAADEESLEVGKAVAYRALERFIAKATAVGWQSQPPEARRQIAEDVLARPQIPQRTPAWYAQGKEVLTASEFAKLLGSPRAASQLVMSKVATVDAPQTNRLACMTCEMGPFDWGIRFEPVVKQILEQRWGLEIAEAGRILHPTDTHVAASPDGIILAATDPARIGRLLEIKCPITRVIGGAVPYDYWCQMQIQMEVTGIDECEYVEVKLDSIQGSATDLSGAEGTLWLLQDPATCVMRYAYTEAERDALSGYELLETVPWRVNKLYAVTVTRDRAWYQSTAEKRREFWENVAAARKGSYQVVEAKQKGKVIVTKEPAACMIIGD